MPKTKPIPDLTRTAAAILAYDKFDEELNFSNMNNDEALAAFAELDRLGEAVGEAFGLDTADRNSVETCKQSIRPGHKAPAAGFPESFVRKTVRKWKEGQQHAEDKAPF